MCVIHEPKRGRLTEQDDKDQERECENSNEKLFDQTHDRIVISSDGA